MKRTMLALALFVAFMIPTRAEAGPFGIGVVLGEPSGVTMQFILSARNALNLAIGVDTLDDEDEFYFHGDYAFYIANLVSTGTFDLPFYVGVGGRWSGSRGGTVGIRNPYGLEMQFRSAPINVFLEIGPTLKFYDDDRGDDDDDVDFDIFAAIGFRYYF